MAKAKIDLNNFNFDFSSLSFDDDNKNQIAKVPRLNPQPVMFENAEKMAKYINWHNDYIAFVSGNFIFGDFIEALLFVKRLRPSVVYLTTLGMNRENVDSIVNLVDYLRCEKVNLVVSHYFSGVERHNMIPYMEQEFKGKPIDVAVLQSHAKIAIIRSEKGDALISGSANLSSSNNVEQFTIYHAPEVIDFVQNKLDNIMDKFTVIKGEDDGKMSWGKNKKDTGKNAYKALFEKEVKKNGRSRQ